MSPLFPSHSHSKPSSPRSRTSRPSFSPFPYILNFKRRVFAGTNDGIVEATCYEFDIAMQRTSGRVSEVPSSFRGKSEIVSNLRKKVANSRRLFNEDGMLPVREVKDRLCVGEKSWEGYQRLRLKNVDKIGKLMTNTVMTEAEAKYNGRRDEESGRGLRSRSLSIAQQDSDVSSISSSNREEFFDAPEDPLEDNASEEETLRMQRTARSNSGGRRDVDGNLKSQLDQEIKRRIAAEDAMAVLQLQCTEMASHLASVDGGSRGWTDAVRKRLNSDSQAQKLVVAQVVASSVARGAAIAEVDEELENVVADRNREIARLRDKLQYYELVNNEMSQRNQEAFELARSRRNMKRYRNQWLLISAGTAIFLGVSAILVCKFVPFATSQLRARAVLQSHTQTDISHFSPSSDI